MVGRDVPREHGDADDPDAEDAERDEEATRRQRRSVCGLTMRSMSRRRCPAEILTEREDTPYERMFRVEDLEGHRWMFGLAENRRGRRSRIGAFPALPGVSWRSAPEPRGELARPQRVPCRAQRLDPEDVSMRLDAAGRARAPVSRLAEAVPLLGPTGRDHPLTDFG